MKKLFLLFLIVFVTACTKVEQYPSIQDKLSKMTSYQTQAEITYISNKGTTCYNTIIYAKQDGKYKITVTAPPDYKDNVVLYDGKLVWQYNPHLENNKISANPPDKQSRREVILFSFLKNYATSMETTVATATAENQKTTVLQAVLPGKSPILASEKLFVDNEKMLPVKLVLYDNKNKERIVVKFNNFEYNKKLEDEIFKLT